MILDLALLADYAYTDSTQKFFILGEFRYLFAASVPAVHPRMVLAIRLIAEKVEVRDGHAKLQIEIVDADANPLVPRSQEAQVGFRPIGPAAPTQAMAQLTIELNNTPLPHYSDYSIHLFVNGQHVGAVAFSVQPVPGVPPVEQQ